VETDAVVLELPRRAARGGRAVDAGGGSLTGAGDPGHRSCAGARAGARVGGAGVASRRPWAAVRASERLWLQQDRREALHGLLVGLAIAAAVLALVGCA
jgi:hypothetical protein